ncbi:hypothetical protein KKF61_00320 [Patescibacteria group bacterium]|nr:hypothetical protein [Patescibacteria group bacterium]MBU0964210.1 hypothetical protein [Patescibacteria group bacterium]
MDKILNIITIASASIIASILVVIGFRKLKVDKYKKYGLFMSTLIVALTLSGCSLLEKTDKTNINDNQQIPTSPVAEYKSDRIKLLNKNQEWKNFQTLWRKLDFINPPVRTGSEADSYFGEYYNAITSEQASLLHNELTTLINRLRNMRQEELILSDTEIDLLEKICQERINYMSYGFSSMLTRMIPPITVTDRENSIKDLELKIDTLIELQNKGIVSSNDFTQALRIIWEDIELFSILDTIATHYTLYYSGSPYDYYSNESGLLRTAQFHINAFEEHYQTYLLDKKLGTENINTYYPEDIENKYKKTKEEIEKVTVILPQLNELIESLVTNE